MPCYCKSLTSVPSIVIQLTVCVSSDQLYMEGCAESPMVKVREGWLSHWALCDVCDS
jgi:hypothetical protein